MRVRDKSKKCNLEVHTDGTAGPYLIVDLRQMQSICEFLNERRIPHYTDFDGIRLNGKQVTVDFNFGCGADPEEIQNKLDSVE